MPLVTIDLLAGRTEQDLRLIGDSVHQAMVEQLDVPQRGDPGRGQASYVVIPPEQWR